MNNCSPVIGNTKTDDLAFVFNFQNKKIYNIEKGEKSIYGSNNILIDFVNAKGGFSFLWINDNCLDSQSMKNQLFDQLIKIFKDQFNIKFIFPKNWK